MYRFSKAGVFDLCENIRPYVRRTVRPTAIPLELKIKYKSQIKNKSIILEYIVICCK